MTLAQMQGRTSMDPRWRTINEDGSDLDGSEHPAMLALCTGQPIVNRVMGVYHPREDCHRWLSVDAVPEFRAGEDEPFQVYATFTDITDRRLAEAALRQSEERFRLTFQASPDAININRLRDGLFVDINHGFTALTGYSREDVVGRTSADIRIWDDQEDRRKLVQGLQINGYYHDLEAKFRRKNGAIAYGRMSAQVILLEGVAHIISITRDISEHTEALKALRANERLLASILHTAPIAIGVVSKRIFTAVNDRFSTMTGYAKEELVGKNSRMVYANDADYEFVGKEKYRQICEYGTGTVETRWRRKDGNIIDILMSSSPIDASNLAAGVTFTALDISERKRAEAEREKLQAQLLQAHKMESVGRLAGGVAHDFNNMLGVILGHTEMLMVATDPTQQLYADLQEIRKAAERSADLTRQLLAFARKQTIALQVLNLNDIVDKMLKLLQRLIGEDIELIWLPARELWPVHMDPSQIDQVLVNICVNARDAIGGVGRVIIETSCVVIDEAYCTTHCQAVAGQYVVLAVSDNGCGMDKDTQEKLFDPFFTTKEMGPVWAWQRCTASSSRTMVLSMFTVNRDRERPLKSTCPATRAALCAE
jgi:two-component system, cell cycle sensor histidine kinase and response regulator CckA